MILRINIAGVLACLVVIAQAQSTVQPVSVVQAEGLEAVFECLYPGATAYEWSFNGTFLTAFPADVDTDFPTVDQPAASLTIPAIPEYNNTVVQCRAIVEVEGRPEFVYSESAMLLLFSIYIAGIENGQDIITLSWVDRPFTTSITYCVDVVQTFGSTETSQLVSSECGLTDTTYSFSSPGHGPCDWFTFTVIPTDGADNGTSSQPVTGYFTQVQGTVDDDATLVSIIENSLTLKKVTIVLNIPDCYKPVYCKVKSDLMVIHNITNCSEVVFEFPTDKKRNVTIRLTDDVNVTYLFEDVPLSTFDLQDMSAVASQTQNNTLELSLTYAAITQAQGALIILIPVLDGEQLIYDFNNTDYKMVLRDNNVTTLTGVSGGEYVLLGYDIEGDGMLQMPTTSVADEEMVYNVTGDQMHPIYPKENEHIMVQMNNEGHDGAITVTCMEPLENCLVVIHSDDTREPLKAEHANVSHPMANLTLDRPGEFNLVVFTWPESGSFLSSSVSLVQHLSIRLIVTTDVFVTNGPGDRQGDAYGLPPGAIAGILCVVVVGLVVVILTVIVAIIAKSTKKFKNSGIGVTQSQETSVPMTEDGVVDWSQTFAGIEQPNSAYSLVMKKNKAYEKVAKQRKNPKRRPVNQRLPQPVQSELETMDGDTVRPHEYEEIIPSRNKPRQNEETIYEQVDGGVDWSQTFAGIEQPNEAYSLIMNKVYEKPNVKSQQEQHDHVVVMNETICRGAITELGERHDYEEIALR